MTFRVITHREALQRLIERDHQILETLDKNEQLEAENERLREALKEHDCKIGRLINQCTPKEPD